MSKDKHHLEPDNWVKNYSDYLFSYAITRLSDREMAEDVVQETFVSAWNGKEGFKGEALEKTWLTSILKRKIIDLYRKKGNSQKEVLIGNFFQEDNEEGPGRWRAEYLPQETLFSDSDIQNKELGEALQKCIAKLPINYKKAFVLKNMQELDSGEICKELDISSSNLWVILHRARISLRECLNKSWYQNG